MTAPYVPQVGDRITAPNWQKEWWIEVVSIDASGGSFRGSFCGGKATDWGYGFGWEPISRRNPDGSVTVLDHTGSELT